MSTTVRSGSRRRPGISRVTVRRSPDAGPETAMVLGELYLRGEEWKFRAVGQGWDSGPCRAGHRLRHHVDESPEPDPDEHETVRRNGLVVSGRAGGKDDDLDADAGDRLERNRGRRRPGRAAAECRRGRGLRRPSLPRPAAATPPQPRAPSSARPAARSGVRTRKKPHHRGHVARVDVGGGPELAARPPVLDHRCRQRRRAGTAGDLDPALDDDGRARVRSGLGGPLRRPGRVDRNLSGGAVQAGRPHRPSRTG